MDYFVTKKREVLIKVDKEENNIIQEALVNYFWQQHQKAQINIGTYEKFKPLTERLDKIRELKSQFVNL